MDTEYYGQATRLQALFDRAETTNDIVAMRDQFEIYKERMVKIERVYWKSDPSVECYTLWTFTFILLCKLEYCHKLKDGDALTTAPMNLAVSTKPIVEYTKTELHMAILFLTDPAVIIDVVTSSETERYVDALLCRLSQLMFGEEGVDDDCLCDASTIIPTFWKHIRAGTILREHYPTKATRVELDETKQKKFRDWVYALLEEKKDLSFKGVIYNSMLEIGDKERHERLSGGVECSDIPWIVNAVLSDMKIAYIYGLFRLDPLELFQSLLPGRTRNDICWTIFNDFCGNNMLDWSQYCNIGPQAILTQIHYLKNHKYPLLYRFAGMSYILFRDAVFPTPDIETSIILWKELVQTYFPGRIHFLMNSWNTSFLRDIF